ncbi:MAG: coproporphyrinogen III oxidase [Magnetospirillum sp.]|nr:MAG: coproporphyrinogen III oxidase [Magnetospirillum sp.]
MLRLRPFGVYIHWPFCRSKCPYCDFNSHAVAAVDHRRWRTALLAELDHFATETPGRHPDSVFFGGGTPSLMEPDTVAALVEAVRQRWDCGPDLEVTLEANPTSVEAGRFQAFRAAGVNRLSLGIQALDDDSLRFLGRHHSTAEALVALELAKATFGRVSFDLIYARPGQTLGQWRAELTRALALAGDHLSLYQLTIEDGTAFSHQTIAIPEDDDAVALFEATQDMAEAAGLPAYEISNHARSGAECRHNLAYWQGGDWLGIGPGAHGRLDGEALVQARSPGDWLAAVERQGHATATRERLDPGARREEMVMMGLRLTAGLDAGLLAEVAASLDPGGLGRMIDGGFVIRDAAGLRTTPRGRLVLNAVLAELLA